MLIKVQVNGLAIVLSSHGLHSPADCWPDKERDILLQGRQSVVIPIHRDLPLATGPYRFRGTARLQLVGERVSQPLHSLKRQPTQVMDPFFGVPMPVTPPAEVRACMATQLGQDVFLSRGGPLDNVTPAGSQITQEEINIAHRFCTTLE